MNQRLTIQPRNIQEVRIIIDLLVYLVDNYPEYQRPRFHIEPLTTNRDSIQRVLNAKKSNHDDNPRSWIKFKVDIVIPVAENITKGKKYHKSFHKRVSDRES